MLSCPKNESQVYYHLEPLNRNHLVSKIWIIRHERLVNHKISKVEYVIVSQRNMILRLICMFFESLKLACRKEVKIFCSFNPIPYGLISALAAWIYKKKIHFGFIGSDWFRDCQSKFKGVLLPLLRKGDFFTVTGEAMKKALVKNGFIEEKIAVLPHAIDLDKFEINDPGDCEYACIYVGQLIERKRVDIIIQAFAKVIQTLPNEKLCIIGEGPEEDDLKMLTRALGIESKIDFMGMRYDVHSQMKKAKIIVIASNMEGFPFSLVEGICCGLVPVSSNVGTIAEHIKHDHDGILFESGDAIALAKNLLALLTDEKKYTRLREESIKKRPQFAMSQCDAIWQAWLTNE